MHRRHRYGALTYRIIADASAAPSAPNSPTFVLAHGIGMSHRSLGRLHDELSPSARVFSIDLPGHAGLPKPRVDGTVDLHADVPRMARGLADAIASLDLGPVVLIGHSMGAQWITAVAQQSPELVDRLVLIGPVVDPARRTLPHQAGALVRDSLGESPRTNSIVISDFLRCGTPWYTVQARHMFDYRIEEEVANLTVPILIVRGERDAIATLEWCRRLGDQAKSSTLVTIPDHRHVVQHSASRDVAAAIQAFAHDRAPKVGVVE